MKRRVLWVKPGGLWPPTSGGRLRSFHIARELSLRSDLTVLTTHGPGEEPAALARALPACETISFPHAPPKQGSARFAVAVLRSWLSPLPVDPWRWRVPALLAETRRRLASGRVDVCVADFLTAVPNVPRRHGAPVVLFEHNVEHVIWRRLAAVERRPWRLLPLAVEWRRVRRFEGRACAGASLTVAVSEADREALEALAPGAAVRAIPTGVDADYFRPNGAGPPSGLVFSGSMDWYPNEDAVLYFLEQILPRVRREVPGASLTVVGRNPGRRLRAAAGAAGVRVTGTVPDVRPFLDAAAVFVLPLRVGGGTRLKVLEALAMGKAVVSTRVGVEGLPVEHGEHFIRADEPEAFARAVVSLLCLPARRASLGDAGRRFVCAGHSWTGVAREFEACLDEVSPCA